MLQPLDYSEILKYHYPVSYDPSGCNAMTIALFTLMSPSRRVHIVA